MGTASAGATPQPLHRLQPLLLASTEMTSGNPNQTCPAPTARSATPGRGCHRPPRPIFAVTVQEHLNSARDHQKVCTSTPNLSSASVEWILRPTPANREIVFHSWKWKLYNCVPALFYHMKSPHKTVRDSKPNRRARVRGPIQILVPGNAVDF